jgi:hypothetical protein
MTMMINRDGQSCQPEPGWLELDLLESLPCGCVAAAYRAAGWTLNFVSLEAQGPHCPLNRHKTGVMLGFTPID